MPNRDLREDEYNGWKNRETWAVALHIDNDEGLYRERCDMAQMVIDRARNGTDKFGVWSDRDTARFWMADRLRNWVETLAELVYFPEDQPSKELLGMFNDIGSIWRVDWQEIADHFLDDSEGFNTLSDDRNRKTA